MERVEAFKYFRLGSAVSGGLSLGWHVHEVLQHTNTASTPEKGVAVALAALVLPALAEKGVDGIRKARSKTKA